MYRLYLVTNLRNGKKYVGMTKFSLRRRWLQHQQAARNPKAYGGMLQAIRKYGAEAFTIEEIGQSDDWEVLKRMEQEAIQTYNTYAPHGQGYNMTLGGDGTLGAPVSEEERQRRSERATGRRHTEASRALMSMRQKQAIAEGRRTPGFTSEAHKEAFFAASKASHSVGWQPSEATRQIWRRQRTGRQASPETRAKMSASRTGVKVPSRGRKGREPWNKGIPATPAHREKAAVYSRGALNGRARAIELDGVRYAYIKEAMAATGRSFGYIARRLRDGRARYLDEEAADE